MRNYHYLLLRNDPEERSPNLLCGGSLKSRIRFRIVKVTCLPFPLCLNPGRLWLYLALQGIAVSSCSTEGLTSLARVSENSCKNLQNPTSLYERILIVFLSACNFQIVFPLTCINRMEELEGNRVNVSYFNWIHCRPRPIPSLIMLSFCSVCKLTNWHVTQQGRTFA